MEATMGKVMVKRNAQSRGRFRGDRLREARMKAGFTQDEVEVALGLGNNTMSRYEQGKSRPLPDRVARFADMFGVSMEFLLDMSSDPNAALREEDLTDDEKAVMKAYRQNDMSTYMRLILERHTPDQSDQ